MLLVILPLGGKFLRTINFAACVFCAIRRFLSFGENYLKAIP